MILKSYVVPGLPHPLLCPEKNKGYQNLKYAFLKIKSEIEEINPDLILVYSTMWPSILGHQLQSKETLSWRHVDDDFHDLGTIEYTVKMDSDFAGEYAKVGQTKGLLMKTVSYEAFPLDTGSVVALKLINPNNKFKACIVSSNIYADRAETVVLGKSASEALKNQNKKAVAIVVTTLSNRLHQELISSEQDKIHSLKDNEWNLKLLEFFSKGRLEDISQLSRQVHKEARVKKVGNFKPFWWLSAVSGSHNRYVGEVLAYEPVYGTGSAVISLKESDRTSRDLEFDEDSPDFYQGERNVLADDDSDVGAQ